MKFAASKAALDHVSRAGTSLRAIANWTLVKRRYREPTIEEILFGQIEPDQTVVLDEGLYFIKDGSTIKVRTQKELGLPHA